MAYNQTLKTSTTTCLTADTGYCAESLTTTETTYYYFDVIYLIFKIALAFWVIFYLIGKKRK